MSKQRVTLYLDSEVWRQFRAACVRRGYSASEIAETLIREQMFTWSRIGAEETDSTQHNDKPKQH